VVPPVEDDDDAELLLDPEGLDAAVGVPPLPPQADSKVTPNATHPMIQVRFMIAAPLLVGLD
jgi:hypothetical protein